MSHTDASYKLSIRFEDFYKKNDGGFHYPFGKVVENDKIGLKQLWFLKKYLKPETPVTDYSNWLYTNMALVNNNVLFKNEDKELEHFDFQHHTAYHFDANKIWTMVKRTLLFTKGC